MDRVLLLLLLREPGRVIDPMEMDQRLVLAAGQHRGEDLREPSWDRMAWCQMQPP